MKELITKVIDGEVTLSLPELEGERVLITVDRVPKRRSLKANRFYFGALVRAISDYTGMVAGEVHEIFKLKFNPREVPDPLTGEIKTIGGSTRSMSPQEFEEHIFKVQEVAERLGIKVLAPDKYWDSLEQKETI